MQLYPERFVLDVLFVESQYFAMFVFIDVINDSIKLPKKVDKNAVVINISYR